MNNKKNGLIYLTIAALTVFGVVGWSLALHRGGEASAQNDGTKVDGETLDSIYDAVFHRAADTEGRGFHLGRNLKDVLRDFRNSPEQRYYGALFKAVKSYEEDQRAPGILTAAEKQAHLDLIESALSTLLAWVDTLPDRNICQAVIGAEEARKAIQAAFDGMSPAAKAAAEKGVFNALRHLGRPNEVEIHDKCVRASASPSVSPSVSPSMSPTPTAS